MTGYELSRSFWDYSFENPEKMRPIHSSIFFFAIEHCNRMGWKQKFGFPTTMAMDAIGIKSYNTYIGGLQDLVEMGFIKMIQKSKNQYSANIIALSKYDKALDKALDKAVMKHGSKHSESTGESSSSIDKPITYNQEPLNNKPMSEIKISEVPLELKEYFEIAEAFRNLFIKNLKEAGAKTKTQDKAKFKNYADQIRLMFENDDATKEQFQKVFRFLDSKQGDFWKSNILSITKLRQQFDKLTMDASKVQTKEYYSGRQTKEEISNNYETIFSELMKDN